MTSLKEVDLLRCMRVSDAGVRHLISISTLEKLWISETGITVNGVVLLSSLRNLSVLDLGGLSVTDPALNSLQALTKLQYLDLWGSKISNKGALVLQSLKNLNLSGTRISSAGIGILAGHVPKLEILCLSHTSIDDVGLSYISLMPSLKVIDLSNTNIKGFIHQPGTESHIDRTLTALQNLSYLESLNLEHTQVRDPDLYTLSSCKELSHLYLNCAFLTDATLHHVSSLPKLTDLHVCEAVLTNSGLDTFSPPTTLRVLDLMGCWLLSEDAISSFSRKHPRVETRHEVVQNLSTEQQNISHRPSASWQSWKTSRGNKKQGKVPISQFFVGESKIEVWQRGATCATVSPLSLESPRRTGIVIPSLQSDQMD
ncbi:hypothetical protein CRYUN_Cryun19dG0113700 [Craigia yunnanensis]